MTSSQSLVESLRSESRITKRGRKDSRKYAEKFGHDDGLHARRTPDLNRKAADGRYLRSIMPRNDAPIHPNHIDYFEAECTKFIERKALENNVSCDFVVPAMTPGIPPYKTEDVVRELYKRYTRIIPDQTGSEPLKVFGKDKSTLTITWGKL